MPKKRKASLGWLLNTGLPLVIEGAGWREKQRQALKLPRWFYKPRPEVREFFQAVVDGLEPEPNDILRELLEDHFKRDLVAFLWFGTSIRDRDTRKRIRPDWTPGQLCIAWRVMALVDEGKQVRLDLLKERQGGFSTLFSNIVYWVVAFHENIGALQAAQDKDTTKQLFRYVYEVFEMQPRWLRPAKRYSSRMELDLTEPNEEKRLAGDRGLESNIQAQTVGKDFIGTGLPVQVLHASEIGKWHKVCDVEPTYTSVANAIQDQPWTFIFRESTAHGAGTYWNKEWDTSMRMGKRGWNSFTPVFLPWYFDPRNRLKVPPGTVWCEQDSDEFGNEVELMKLFDLDEEQMEWRRAAIRKQGAGVRAKVELFKQEHPGTQAEAWLFAGGKFVSATTILLLRARAEKKPGFVFQGDLEPRRELGKDLPFARWVTKRPLGPFTMWHRPDPRYEYVIGADVAEGLTGGDMSCAKVYRRLPQSLYLMAEFWGHAPTDVFAHMLWRLGWYYSAKRGRTHIPALLAWERTGPGQGIHAWLKSGNIADPSDNYPASRQYRSVAIDKNKQRRDQRFGIATTRMGKRPMLDMWLEWVASLQLDLIPPDIDEAETLEVDDGLIETGGRDRTMASVMAVFAHRTHSMLVFPSELKNPEPVYGTGAWADKILAKGDKKRKMRGDSARVLWTGGMD